MRPFTKRLTGLIIRTPIKREIKYLFLLLLVVWSACKGPKDVSGEAAQSGEKALTLLLSDLYGGAGQEELRIIRDPAELIKCFAIINRTRKPGLPVPKIDFDKNVALLYSPGKMHDTVLPELYYAGKSVGKLIVGVKPKETKNEEQPGAPVVEPFLLYTIPARNEEIGLSDRPGALIPK